VTKTQVVDQPSKISSKFIQTQKDLRDLYPPNIEIIANKTLGRSFGLPKLRSKRVLS